MAKSAAAPADAGGSKKAGVLPRLSVPLTADKSRFAVENMTDPVKERLRAVLTDPELRSKLQLPDERPAAPVPAAELLPDTWDAGFTGVLYDLLGKIFVALAARQGFTPAEAAVLEFTEADKAQLAGPTAAVLDKYLPGGLTRYGPEFVLGAALLVVMQGKFSTLERVTAERLAAAPATGTVRFPQAAAQVQ